MITSQVRTATTTPLISAVRGTSPSHGIATMPLGNTLLIARAIEFGCVNGVVVSAATPAINA